MLELHPKTVKKLRIEQDYKSWKLQLKHLQGNKGVCTLVNLVGQLFFKYTALYSIPTNNAPIYTPKSLLSYPIIIKAINFSHRILLYLFHLQYIVTH